MDEDKLFEIFDKIPEINDKVSELIEAVKHTDKNQTDSVASISRGINELTTKLRSIESMIKSVHEASKSTQTAQAKPAEVHVTTELSQEDKEEIVRLSIKESSKQTLWTKICSFVPLVILLVLAYFGAMIYDHFTDNYLQWTERAVNVAEAAGDMHPGDRGVAVIEEFKRGKTAREAKKAEIRALEEKYNENWRNNASVLKLELEQLLQKEIKVLDYDARQVEGKGYEALIIFRYSDSEKEYRAMRYMTGHVMVTEDTDINTRLQAITFKKRPSWIDVGTIVHESKDNNKWEGIMFYK